MRSRIVLGMIALMAIAASLAVPGLVKAVDVTIDAGDTYTRTYDLNEFGYVFWSWHVQGQGTVDFWVEDEDGTRYNQVSGVTSDTDTFTADESGKYYLKWENDGSSDVTVDYTITHWGLNEAEEIVSGMILAVIVVGVIILVVIILVVVAVVYAGKKKKAPDAQQQQQQQYYQQQQQYQQPYQQQQYPQQQYPQQPQDPQQPQQPGQQKPPEQ
ncbi:MAG: DUF4834 family protein [Thermoplasmata archaeon]|nr:DUF4834 family protein [Thermoplasmata archaeon]